MRKSIIELIEESKVFSKVRNLTDATSHGNARLGEGHRSHVESHRHELNPAEPFAVARRGKNRPRMRIRRMFGIVSTNSNPTDTNAVISLRDDSGIAFSKRSAQMMLQGADAMYLL